MIYAFTWDALVVEVCIQSSLFYKQIFLNEFLEKTRHFPRSKCRIAFLSNRASVLKQNSPSILH